jgi:hypothetical protein
VPGTSRAPCAAQGQSPALGGRGRGDLRCSRLVVQKRLTSEQRKLFEQLGKTLPVPDVADADRSLLERMKDLLG